MEDMNCNCCCECGEPLLPVTAVAAIEDGVASIYVLTDIATACRDKHAVQAAPMTPDQARAFALEILEAADEVEQHLLAHA